MAHPAVSWEDIMHLSFQHLDLVGVWCLSLTSKAAQEFSVQRMSERNYDIARDLLIEAVTAAADSQKPTQQAEKQLVAALEWLLTVEFIPSCQCRISLQAQLLTQDSIYYLSISHMDPSVRQALLNAGLPLEYDMVVTAARQLAMSLDQWIEDCEELGFDLENNFGINSITKAACCSDPMDLDPEYLNNSEVILDHLYLAVNCIGNCDYQKHNNACKNIIGLCMLLARHEPTSVDVEMYLHAVVQVIGTRQISNMPEHVCEDLVVDTLCRLKVVQELSVTAVFDLLDAAVQTLPFTEMTSLFNLPAAWQFTPEQTVELTEAFFRAFVTAPTDRYSRYLDNEGSFDRILELLRTMRLPQASRMSLFKSTIQLFAKDPAHFSYERACFIYSGVWGMPGMSEFGSDALVDLLRVVLETHGLPETAVSCFVILMCACPAAAAVSQAQVDLLVQLACSDTVRNRLRQLPGAAAACK